MRNKLFKHIGNFSIFLVMFSFGLVGEVGAFSESLDRVLGITMVGEELLVADAGGRNWSNNGSEIFIFGNDGKISSFGEGLVFAHSVEVMRNGSLLITDTGNDRVLEVSREGEVVWSSEEWEGVGLDYPNDAEEVEGGVYVISDRNNDRVIKVDRDGNILFEFLDLIRPHNVDYLESGNLLISDSERNRVIEVDEEGMIVWEYDRGLNWPRDIDLMKNGNYLITDSRSNRVVEVTRSGEIVWEYGDLYWPYEADELPNGNILVADSQNRRVVEIDHEGVLVDEWRVGDERVRRGFMNGGFEDVGKFEADVVNERDWKGIGVDVNRLIGGEISSYWIPGVQIAEDSGMIAIDDEVVKEGEKSVRLEYEGEGNLFLLQRFKVDPGKYQLSGFVKTESFGKADRGARFEVWLESERGGYVGQPVVSEVVSGDGGWKKIGLVIEVPEDVYLVEVRALFNDGGKVWFDGIGWGSYSLWMEWGKWFGLGLTVVILIRVFGGILRGK